MKIELRNVKVFEAMSEETTAFHADVYVNGKKICYAKNDGRGGETYYHPYENCRDEINLIEEFYKNSPPKKYRDFEIKMSLTMAIDDLLEEFRMSKFLKKDMEKGICVKTEIGYEIIQWTIGRKKIKLKEMLSTANGKDKVISKINELKQNKKIILNTNLEI